MTRRIAIPLAALAVVLALVAVSLRRCERKDEGMPLGQTGTREPDRTFDQADVTFQSGSVSLYGTLYLPRNGDSLPAIVLAHGRTEFARRQALFVVLAERLAARGYAVLSFDFRGFGQSEDPPRIETPEDLDFAGDLTRALDLLAATTRVDAGRLFLVGHSFGGGVVLRVAIDDPRVRKAVSLSPPRRSYELFFDEQAKRMTQLQEEMMDSMHLSPPVPTTLLYPVLERLVPEILIGIQKHPPILFVEGSLENEIDRAAMKLLYDQIAPPKEYAVIEGAYHYFGTKRLARGSEAASVKFQADILDRLADTVDRWLSQQGGDGAPHTDMIDE